MTETCGVSLFSVLWHILYADENSTVVRQIWNIFSGAHIVIELHFQIEKSMLIIQHNAIDLLKLVKRFISYSNSQCNIFLN